LQRGVDPEAGVAPGLERFAGLPGIVQMERVVAEARAAADQAEQDERELTDRTLRPYRPAVRPDGVRAEAQPESQSFDTKGVWPGRLQRGSAGLPGNAKDCYRREDLAAVTKAASSASRFSRSSAWMENIQGLSTLPHSIPYTGNRSG
jgi:hypothetical protein